MLFRASPTWPTSVRGSVYGVGTRSASATSPESSSRRETREAVAATRSRGSRLRRTRKMPPAATTSSPRPVPVTIRTTSWLTVSLAPEMGKPVMATVPRGV